MKIENLLFENSSWSESTEDALDVNLVMLFGNTDEFENAKHYEYLKSRYPNADIIGCSSSGNILGGQISEANMVATAISFDKATTLLKSVEAKDGDDIQELSKNLASEFEQEGLKHIFILADGLKVNGSNIIKGFNEVLPDIAKTGGMAGDGERVERTYVVANDIAKEGVIAAVGFYGDSLRIGNGTQGGWTPFGTPRVITKSQDNVLYEIDGEAILDYYRRYVGEYADDLQNAGFKFPLSVKESEESIGVIRTLLGVNEEEKSITFAGDVPQGHIAQLMKPDIDSLISGAADAAKDAKIESENISLALVVSCTGRRAVMGQIIDEELEAIQDELGDNAQLVGFYSYGELAPLKSDVSTCILHNETMTLTVIYED